MQRNEKIKFAKAKIILILVYDFMNNIYIYYRIRLGSMIQNLNRAWNKKWPDKSTTIDDMLDFKRYIKKMQGKYLVIERHSYVANQCILLQH